MAEEREYGLGKRDNERHGAKQRQTQDKCPPNSDAPRTRLMFDGQLVGKDRNKDQIVYAEDNFEYHQSDKGNPGSRVIYKCEMGNKPIHEGIILQQALEGVQGITQPVSGRAR